MRFLLHEFLIETQYFEATVLVRREPLSLLTELRERRTMNENHLALNNCRNPAAACTLYRRVRFHGIKMEHCLERIILIFRQQNTI